MLPAELALLANKTGVTRLGFAVLPKSFQLDARFPQRQQDVPGAVVVFVAKQVSVAPEEFLQYQWRGRTIEYHLHRSAPRFRQAIEQDESALTAWLAEALWLKIGMLIACGCGPTSGAGRSASSRPLPAR